MATVTLIPAVSTNPRQRWHRRPRNSEGCRLEGLRGSVGETTYPLPMTDRCESVNVTSSSFFNRSFVKSIRSLATGTALAAFIALLPLSSNQAAADSLLLSAGTLTATAGQLVSLRQLFTGRGDELLLVGNIQVSFTGGLAFTDGSIRVTFPSIEAAFSTPFVVTSSGFVALYIRSGLVPPNRPVEDVLLRAEVRVIPIIATKPPITVAPTTVPVTAPPATVAPPAPVPPPATVPPALPGPVPTTPPAAPVAGNRPPVAVGRSVVGRKNTATEATLKGTDPEGSPLTYSIVDFPENGRLTGRAPNLSYVPNSGFVGTDAFTFTVSDGISTSEPAAVSVTVRSTQTSARRAPRTARKR